MSETDWKNAAFQIHLAFHQIVLDPAELWTSKIPTDDAAEQKEELQKIIRVAHDMFDSVINWVNTLSDENLKLKGALEELRRVQPR